MAAFGIGIMAAASLTALNQGYVSGPRNLGTMSKEIQQFGESFAGEGGAQL
jgi:hypothetical protein